jgi:hypothetical protein
MPDVCARATSASHIIEARLRCQCMGGLPKYVFDVSGSMGSKKTPLSQIRGVGEKRVAAKLRKRVFVSAIPNSLEIVLRACLYILIFGSGSCD